MSKSPLSYAEVIRNAQAQLASFQSLIKSVPYEAKGILNSEILFLLSCVGDNPVRRILESGRARGQSTLTLALAAPQLEVVSIEYDEKSPDVIVAGERLKDIKNVTLLFGDACVLLPTMIQEGDVVLIDGPKMFKAIRLALQSLATTHVTYAFVHDIRVGTVERMFLKHFFPEALYSDYRAYAEVAGILDASEQAVLPESARLNSFKGEYGYGYSLTCIPFASRSYRALIAITFVYDACSRPFRILRMLTQKGGNKITSV